MSNKKLTAKVELNDVEANTLAIRGYTIGEPISAGSFGVVFKADRHGTPCAVKLIDMNKSKCQEIINEICILKTVEHPNVVQVMDFFLIHEKDILIFMEFLAGGDLYAFITQNSRLTEPVAANLFKQIAQAMAFMHGQGYAHRDLKPGNVLLDETKSVAKVADFGLSKLSFNVATGEESMADTWCGTPCFMAPEIFFTRTDYGHAKGVRQYDPFAADVWAMGVILYQMLHRGCYPFAFEKIPKYKGVKESSQAYYNLLSTSVVLYSRSITDAAKYLCWKMFQLNCKQRPDMMTISKDGWLHCAKEVHKGK